MQCEVCGHRIEGKPYRAIIEGAKMTVCEECAKLGSVSWEAPQVQRTVKKKAKPALRVPPKRTQPELEPELTQTLELVDDFSLRVGRAREKLGLSHEDLGKKIGEKVSVLRKIESGKMVPDHRLANKLEHELKIDLLVPISEPKIKPVSLSMPREATLGDVAQIKGKKSEEGEGRKPS
jgi:putative transcription factor